MASHGTPTTPTSSTTTHILLTRASGSTDLVLRAALVHCLLHLRKRSLLLLQVSGQLLPGASRRHLLLQPLLAVAVVEVVDLVESIQRQTTMNWKKEGKG